MENEDRKVFFWIGAEDVNFSELLFASLRLGKHVRLSNMKSFEPFFVDNVWNWHHRVGSSFNILTKRVWRGTHGLQKCKNGLVPKIIGCIRSCSGTSVESLGGLRGSPSPSTSSPLPPRPASELETWPFGSLEGELRGRLWKEAKSGRGCDGIKAMCWIFGGCSYKGPC